MRLWETEEANKLADYLGVKKLTDSLLFPQYFQIETVHACNSRCVMCSIDWENGRNNKIQDIIFNKFVEEIKVYSQWIKGVCLQGAGEPTLDVKLPERVKSLKEIGIHKVFFSTNGSLLTAELTAKLMKNGLDDIMISIDAINAETYKKIRPNLEFDKVMHNILNTIEMRDAVKSPMIIRVRLVEQMENQHEVAEWTEFWKTKLKKFDRIDVTAMHTFGNQLKQETDEDVALYADKICSSLFSTMIINSDGIVNLCCADCNGQHIMGDFSKQTLKAIWNEEKFMEYRKQHLMQQRNAIKMCRGCHIW